jgi:hypothetical protein
VAEQQKRQMLRRGLQNHVDAFKGICDEAPAGIFSLVFTALSPAKVAIHPANCASKKAGSLQATATS